MGTFPLAVSSAPAPDVLKAKASTSSMNPLLRKHTATPPASDRQERTSFASFKEDRGAIAQSFIDSKISSYTRVPEDAIDDSASEENNVEPDIHHLHPFNAPMAITNPTSMLNSFICPCDGFRGWKQIAVGGRLASRSFSDLRISGMGAAQDSPAKKEPQKKLRNDAGQSDLERLPMELLRMIRTILKCC